MSEPQPDAPPEFDAAFRDKLRDLFLWRRDVRRFRTVPLPDGLVEGLLAQAALAPSVGNSQPWRFVIVEDPARRKRVRDDFETANKDALEGYSGERARTYAGLKLAGLDRAPVQLAVFSDQATVRGHGLGQNTMPEMLPYSVVAAVNTLWLAARAAGVGVGLVGDGAGVHHTEVGAGGPGGGLRPQRLQLLAHALGVVLVGLAAEGVEVDAHGPSLPGPRGGVRSRPPAG